MFCTKCGLKAGENGKFCTRCGHPLGAAPAAPAASPAAKALEQPGPAGEAVCVAVHLKIGVIKREPWALWMSPARGAMIRVGEERYQSATGFSHRTQSGQGEDGFRRYAQGLAAQPLEQTGSETPKWVAIRTEREDNPGAGITIRCGRFAIEVKRGRFRWPDEGGAVKTVDERQLRWLLDGLALCQPQAHREVRAERCV